MSAKSKWKALGKFFSRTLIVLLSTVLVLVLFLLGVMGVLIKGPSRQAEKLFVLSTHETSAIYWLPRIFLSEEQMDAIINPPLPEAEPEKVDTFTELPYEDGRVESTEVTVQVPNQEELSQTDLIEIVDVRGSTFKGKMMIVHDPSLVVFGTLNTYGDGVIGLTLTEFIERYGAIGGTNAGGFYDPNGGGTGGIPDGLVIRDGKLAWGNPGSFYKCVIGFDANYVMHVGDMTGQEALDLGIVSAVSFANGPVLVQNGELKPNLGGGMNPRTFIGQRADGAVLLIVVEGRRPDSLGATYDDIAKVMYDNGAINAGNLDGGSSSVMYYEGEAITHSASVIGMRELPTCVLVMSPEGGVSGE